MGVETWPCRDSVMQTVYLMGFNFPLKPGDKKQMPWNTPIFDTWREVPVIWHVTGSNLPYANNLG